VHNIFVSQALRKPLRPLLLNNTKFAKKLSTIFSHLFSLKNIFFVPMKQHNFNSGPSILPQQVLDQASQAILNLNGIGLSILEISHRSQWFIDIIEEAKVLVKQLMQINNDYEVLFLHGGATTQFMQVPMNLLDTNAIAAYCDDGIWGKKAVNEAAHFGNVNVVASSKDKEYSYINYNFDVPQNAAYLHITTNNTVEGTQWQQLPKVNVPLIADMSSDIFSRDINFSQCDVIYAGSQKNMGAAGVNLVVIKKELLGKIQRPIPTIMSYQKHIEASSLLNTPPVFAVYVAMLTLRWIVAQGGLLAMEKQNNQKSNLLYNTIDSLPMFSCKINPQDRSKMNAVFFIKDTQLQDKFLETCKQNGMIGVKGYRTVGGIRVSLYNALPLESVEAFTQLMQNFAQKNG
jgi:phosphoserine aminotransferase